VLERRLSGLTVCWDPTLSRRLGEIVRFLRQLVRLAHTAIVLVVLCLVRGCAT
jgi:hypothetical protein